MFLDTTPISFEGEGGQDIGQRGYSKDHRPDLHPTAGWTTVAGRSRCKRSKATRYQRIPWSENRPYQQLCASLSVSDVRDRLEALLVHGVGSSCQPPDRLAAIDLVRPAEPIVPGGL
jgi:hypothetical protein